MPGKAEFVKTYGGIYEHSPWIAEAAFDAGAHTPEQIQSAMKMAVDAAPREKKLALIKAHPELGSKVKMAEASVKEQAGAGLDQCSPEEFAEFKKLNADYNQKFGFPFIVAVKGLTRADILKQFRERLNNEVETEFETAIVQIHKIAAFRLAAMVDPEKKERVARFEEDVKLQTLFLRSLLVGEINWLVVGLLIFLFDAKHDLLSFLGVIGYVTGAILAVPIFALVIYVACKILYMAYKKSGYLPRTDKDLMQLMWKANAFALPVIVLISWLLFSLYFESFESYTQAVSGAVHP